MTRLDQVRHDAQKLLVFGMAGLVPVYGVASLAAAPDKAFTGSVILAVVTGIAALSWRVARDEASTRMIIGAAMMAFPACLTFMMSGRAWQIDMHMVFFAALAAVTVLCDWRALVAAAGAAAVHHLALNFAYPAAVFPGGGDFLRVVFHAVVVIGQTGVLIWLAHAVTRALTDADAALVDANAAKAEADKLADADKANQRRTEQARTRISTIATGFEGSVRAVLADVQASATELADLAQGLAKDAGATRGSARSAADMALETSGHVDSVASAAQELAASIAEVTRTLGDADAISERAETEAGRAGASMDDLETAAREIEDIAALVTNIAEQTNLLALNATIEAARAGEAGKGFAVVASEVKELADQTGKATEDIRTKIDAMRRAADGASRALTQISGTIGEVRQASSGARGAFAEQSSATDEIARLASDAAASTAQVGEEAEAVTGAAGRAEAASDRFKVAADGLGAAAARLSDELARFRSDLDSAA